MSTNHIISGLAALDEARPDYDTAWSFYEGNANETFTSPLLQKALGSDSPDFSFNYARLVVQARLSRMEIASVLSQNGTADNELAQIWADNALDQEIQEALEAALVYGDAYLIGSSNEDSFDIFYNSPLDTRVFYETENPRRKSYAIKRWEQEGKLRVNLYYADRTERWISKGKAQHTYVEGDFIEYITEDEAWPLPNETGQIPVFHLRTGRMYGTPEHKQAYGPQRAITKLLESQLESIDYQSGPQRYVLQDSAANSGVDAASDFGDDDSDDGLGSLKSGPKGLWNLKGVRSVGQFDAADPAIFVQPFKTFIEAMGTVTSTPVHAFNVGALPSGESLRAAEAPLNKRVESLELLFGGVIRELHEYALDCIGVAETKVLVTWAPAATYDSSDIWATAKAKNEAGVPMRVALLEAGYTQTQIDDFYPEGVAEPRTPEQLVALADAMMKISVSITNGLITKEEARAMLPQDFLGELPVVDGDSVIEALNNSYNTPPE